MVEKPTYEELEYRVKVLEREFVWRCQAEDALRKSERQLRFITENATDVIWEMGLDGSVKYLTPSFEFLSGYSVEEGMAMNLREFLTPDSYQRATNIILERMDTDQERREKPYQPIILELEYRHKDGSVIFGETSARFTRDSEGNPKGLIGVTRNIQDRKLAEEAFRKKRKALERQVDEFTKNLDRAIKERDAETAERKSAEAALREERKKLQEARARIKTLSGLLPICASCKNTRDDKAYLKKVEKFVRNHSETEWSDSKCPNCGGNPFPDS